MNQSTVPHSEISIRLSICSEFLIDEKKSIKKAYESLKEKLGEKIMKYSEFKYWFKRFQNNQFDLGYDTSQDSEEVSEIQKKAHGTDDNSAAIIATKDQIKVVESKMKDLKFDHQLGNKNEISENQNKTERKIYKIEKVVLQSGIEIPRKIAPKVMEERDGPMQFVDMNTEFTNQNLPQNFQNQVNKKKSNLNNISMSFGDSCCWLDFDDLKARFERKGEIGHWLGWRLRYKGFGEKNRTLSLKPEKFIVDHLWFVLKNPEIQLKTLKIEQYNSKTDFMNLKKFDFILKSMFNSFENHQIHLTRLHIQCFNAETFHTILKQLKPETLEEINFQVFEKGNSAKWKEIVELEQWKLAKIIVSPNHTPLKIDNVLHCKTIEMACEVVTPEDVLRVTNHFLASSNTESCTLSALDEFMDNEEIENVLQSGDLIPKITKSLFPAEVKFCYELPKSAGFLNLTLNENKISISKSCK